MRRFMTTTLIAATLVIGTLSLSGCIVVPRHDRERVVVHDRGGYHHDRDHDHDHWH